MTEETDEVAKRYDECVERTEVKADAGEEVTQTQKINGCLMTLILVPLALLGTCIPLSLADSGGRGAGFLFAIYGLVIIALLAKKANDAKNVVVKWLMITMCVLLFLFLSVSMALWNYK